MMAELVAPQKKKIFFGCDISVPLFADPSFPSAQILLLSVNIP